MKSLDRFSNPGNVNSKSKKTKRNLRRPKLYSVPSLKYNGDNSLNALRLYKKYQILHLRSDPESWKYPDCQNLINLWNTYGNIVDKTWNVENAMSSSKQNLSRENLFGSDHLLSLNQNEDPFSEFAAWYISFIVQSDETLINRFLDLVPCSNPLPLQSLSWDVKYSNPIWIFLGKNMIAKGGKNIQGRSEHTDSVSHSGTWHFQLAGRKIWQLRPLVDSKEWAGKSPSLRISHKRNRSLRHMKSINASEENRNISCIKRGGNSLDGKLRLQVECSPGDILLVNTRLWWHQTELPSTIDADNQISLSYARDFMSPHTSPRPRQTQKQMVEDGMVVGDEMSNIEGIYASRNVRKGDIVLTEEELPNCSLPRSKDPNCEVTCIGDVGALIALRNIESGEWLSVMSSSDEEDDSDGGDSDEDESEGDT